MSTIWDFLAVFLMIRLRLWVWGSKVPFNDNISRVHTVNITCTVDVQLDHLAEGVFSRFFCWKLLFPLFSNCILRKKAPLCYLLGRSEKLCSILSFIPSLNISLFYSQWRRLFSQRKMSFICIRMAMFSFSLMSRQGFSTVARLTVGQD